MTILSKSLDYYDYNVYNEYNIKDYERKEMKTETKTETKIRFSVHIPGGIDVITEGKTSKEAIQNWLKIVTNENYEFDKIVFTRV